MQLSPPSPCTEAERTTRASSCQGSGHPARPRGATPGAAVARFRLVLPLWIGILSFQFGAALPQPLAADAATEAERILEAVRRYVEQGVRYDASYVRLPYPGGEPPGSRGACTDLVVRGLRALGIDLQREVQEDILRAPGEYRRSLTHYGSSEPDPSIDHRRVANLEIYFRRHLVSLPAEGPRADWQPGDLVVWDQNRDGWADHAGVVGEQTSASGRPLVYHNYPRRGHHPGVAYLGDCLDDWKRVGHYRVSRPGPR